MKQICKLNKKNSLKSCSAYNEVTVVLLIANSAYNDIDLLQKHKKNKKDDFGYDRVRVPPSPGRIPNGSFFLRAPDVPFIEPPGGLPLDRDRANPKNSPFMYLQKNRKLVHLFFVGSLYNCLQFQSASMLLRIS